MLDIRKPLGLLFIILGAMLFLYGAFIQKEVMFFTPQAKFPLKLNQPVGLFMFAFGMVMWQLSRYVNIVRLERGLKAREKELEGRPSTEPDDAAEAAKSESAEDAKASSEEVSAEDKSKVEDDSAAAEDKDGAVGKDSDSASDKAE